MTISKPPPSSGNNNNTSTGVESIILQQALYCIEDNYDVMMASPITLQLISSICTNIVTHPNEEKFRKIKIANPKFNDFVMGVEGAVNLLMLCGFEIDDSGEYIILKKENFVASDLKDLIAAIDIKTKNNLTAPQKPSSSSSASSSVVKPTGSSSSVSDAEIEERKKKMMEEKKKIQAEKDKIKQQLLADKEERKHLPTGVCSRKTTKPNSTSKKTFRDIGVELNKGGG